MLWFQLELVFWNGGKEKQHLKAHKKPFRDERSDRGVSEDGDEKYITAIKIK